MKHSELRHQPRHVNPRIQVNRDFFTGLFISGNFFAKTKRMGASINLDSRKRDEDTTSRIAANP